MGVNMGTKTITAKQAVNLKPHELRTLYHNKEELSKAVSAMRKEAKRRYDRIEKSGVSSFAVTMLKKRGGIPKTIRGMDEQELRAYFIKFKTFLTDKTSTDKGIKEEFEKIRNNLHLSNSMSDKEVDKLLEVWTRVREASTTIKPKTEIYYNVLEQIEQQVKQGMSVEDIINNITSDLDAEYLARELEYEQRRSTASYFSTASDFTPLG